MNYRILNKQEVAEKFFWYMRSNFRNLNEAAKKYGVSKQYISLVSKGKRNPTKQMMDDLGIIKIDGWIEEENGKGQLERIDDQ